MAGGDPALTASRRMARSLRGRGIASIRYADGSMHTLAEYAEMSIRTTTARAYNEGSFQLGAQQGVQFYEVFDGTTCGWVEHNDPELADGKIVTDDEARGYPIAHPNCRRTFGARPDLDKKPDGKVPHRTSPPTSAAEARERAQLESGALIRKRRKRADPRGVRAARDRAPANVAADSLEGASRLGPAARALDPTDYTEEQWTAALRETASFTHNGITARLARTTSKPDRAGAFEVEFVDAAGKNVGSARRTFYRNNDDAVIVRHEALHIDKDVQGQGLGTVLNSRMDELYRQVGAEAVELTANIDVGGYAWAKAGYDWKSPDEMLDVLHWYKRGDKGTLTPGEASRLDEWLELGRRRDVTLDDVPTPFDLAMLGWREGATEWYGKTNMLGQSWKGRRVL